MALDPCQSVSTCFSRSLDWNFIIPANTNQHEHSEPRAALLVSAYRSSFASIKQTSSASHLFTLATRTAVVVMGLWDLRHKASCVKRKCLASWRAWHSWGSLLIEFGYFKTGCNDLIKELWATGRLIGAAKPSVRLDVVLPTAFDKQYSYLIFKPMKLVHEKI